MFVSYKPSLKKFKITCRIVIKPGKTNWLYDFRKRNRLAKSQQGNIIVVGIWVKAFVFYYGCNSPLDGLRLRSNLLIVVSKNNSDFGFSQFFDAVSGGEHVILGQQGPSTMELSIIHDSSHPRVLVDTGWFPAYYTDLFIGKTTIFRGKMK